MYEDKRCNEYARLRGNMPVYRVQETGHPTHPYGVRLWLESHNHTENPEKVLWCAGSEFHAAMGDCERQWCAAFVYYGGMMIQCRITFADGVVELVHLYVPAALSPTTEVKT